MLRRALAAGLAVAAVGAGIGCWYGDRAAVLAEDLMAARDSLTGLDPAGLAGGDPTARARLDDAHGRLAHAVRIADGTSWRLLAHAPVAGRAADAVGDLAWAGRELSGPVAATLLRARGDGPFELDGGALREAGRRLDLVHARLAGPPTHVAPLDQAMRDMGDKVRRLREVVGLAGVGTRVLEADRPRRYFLGLQTNAEARGTGGLVGAYAILTVDRGRFRIERLAPNNALRRTRAPVVDLGAEYRARYGDDAAELLQVSNLSPHFPYAARVWTELWRHRTGQRLDGALATDSAGLAELLRATGPVRVPGTVVTADNAVALIERDSYARYRDQAERKRFLLRLTGEVADRLRARATSAPVMAALQRLVADGRLKMWSAHPDEQAAVERTPLGGALDDRPGPFAMLVVNNSGGDKLDHYLDRELRYELGPCRDGRRVTIVRIRLRNAAPPAGLPRYVTGLDGDGRNRVWASLFAARGARLTAASRDGRPVEVRSGTERGRPVHDVVTDLPPGGETRIDLRFDEPAVAGAAPRTPVQPLTRAQRTRVSGDPCG